MSYELRAFVRRRGRWVRVPALTFEEADAHSMAVEVWRLSRLPGPPYRLEVRDVSYGIPHLAPVVTYEELLRRAGSVTVP